MTERRKITDEADARRCLATALDRLRRDLAARGIAIAMRRPPARSCRR